MEIQNERIYLSWNDVSNVLVWATDASDDEAFEWADQLSTRFVHPMDQSDFSVNVIPIPCSPKFIDILQNAHRHVLETREEEEILVLRAMGRMPPEEPTAGQKARQTSKAVTAGKNVVRMSDYRNK